MSADLETAPLAAEPTPALTKAVAFITRDRGLEQELLVLRTAGPHVQLPEATVNLGETPAEAALRLVGELADSAAFELHRRIAVVKETLPPDTRIVLQRSLLRTHPSPDATLMRFSLERGMRVKLTETQADFARVIYEEYALHENELAIATRRAGWVAAEALAGEIEYHLFHLSANLPPGSTALLQEPGQPRKLWEPLSSVADLLPLHQRWLERARRFLTT